MNPRRCNARSAGLIQVLIGVALFAGLAAVLWRQQPASQAVPDAMIPPASTREITGISRSHIAELVRTLTLVTVEVRGTATSEMQHRNWRGESAASVTAAVRYLYGVDLSGIDENDIELTAQPATIVLHLPRPGRISTEVDTTTFQESVKVSGIRLRSRVGEHLLGQARQAVHMVAAKAELSPDQARRMTSESQEAIRELVQKLVGHEQVVDVRFMDRAPSHADAGFNSPRSIATSNETLTSSPGQSRDS